MSWGRDREMLSEKDKLEEKAGQIVLHFIIDKKWVYEVKWCKS